MIENSPVDQAFIHKLTGIVLANLQNENFGVGDLAREASVSPSLINRRLHTIKNQNTSQFIREIRLKRAMELLQQRAGHASEIAYQVGFGSPAYFNHCFHDYYGFTTGEALKYGLTSPGQNSKRGKMEPEEVIPAFKTNRKWVIVSAGILFFLIILHIVYFVFSGKKETIKSISGLEKSLIILPFKDLSPDQDNQYFADGIAEDILSQLLKIKDLRVLSRTSSEQFRGSNLSAPEIARRVNVNFALEGSVRMQEDNMRIIVQLIDARHDRYLWSENYDRQMTDIFAIQNNIALNVAERLQSVLSPEDKQQIQNNHTTNTEAYKYYLMGRFHSSRRSIEGYEKGIAYYEKAIAEDPDYALAYAGLSDNYHLMALQGLMEIDGGIDKAICLAEKALELDPELAEAHAVLGDVYIYAEQNWVKAENQLLQAIRVNPNFSTAHQYYSELLAIMGRNHQAREHIDIALELDPYSFVIRHFSALYYYNDGKFTEALAENQVCLELVADHQWALILESKIHLIMQNESDAHESLRKLGIITVSWSPEDLDSIFRVGGIDGFLRWRLETDEDNYAGLFYYALLGEDEKTLEILESGIKEGRLSLRETLAPEYKNLRSDPRFIALRRELGLPPL